MNKYTLTLLTVMLLNINVQSQDARPQRDRRPVLSEEQKSLHAKIVAKYDINKDGKLDPLERKKITSDDRKIMRDAGLGRRPDGGSRPRKDAPPTPIKERQKRTQE